MADTFTFEQIGQRAMERNPDAFKGITATPDEVGRRIVQRNPSLQSMVATSTPPPAPPAVSNPDTESAQKYGAFFPANTKNPGMISEPAKVVGNLLPSAFDFVKGAIDIMNPISTFNKVKQVAREFQGLAKDAGGYGKALGATAKELPGATYESLVPEAGRAIISAGKGFVTGNDAEVTKGLETAQRAIVNDPVGQIAPFLFAAKAGAKVADTIRNKAAMADYVKNIDANVKNGVPIPRAVPKIETAFDTTITKTAAPVIKASNYVFGGAKNMASNAAKFATSQATGMSPETVSQIVKTPKAFTKEAQGALGDRATLGKEVQSVLNQKSEALSETGKGYAPIREGGATIKVSKTWLDSTIKDLTNLKLKDKPATHFQKAGKYWTASGSSVLRDASDVRAIQHLYDLWKPEFKKGTMTADKFLNFRTDLAKLSKFERQVGKSQPVESMAKLARGRFNEAYRPQLKGLESLDKEFSARNIELKRLSKGFVDKDGNLTDQAMNRIANATGKGKDLLLNRLEETVPGITQKIKILKAVEDIQNASGIKVGAYTRTALTGGAFFAGGPLQGLITAILTSPELAVPLLRKAGLIKNSAAVRAVINALKEINNLPNKTSSQNPQPPAVKDWQKPFVTTADNVKNEINQSYIKVKKAKTNFGKK